LRNVWENIKKRALRAALPSLFAFLFAAGGMGCSINTLVANALTGDGGAAAVFTGDPDPELVGAALPFAIKMYEALLYSTPGHQGLMLTTGSLFVMYANAFVQGPAERLDPIDYFEKRDAALTRAKQLYLRGHRILMDALEGRHRGFSAAAANVETLGPFLQRFRARDVPLLYWTVASGLAAFSLDMFDFELSAWIPRWHLMVERAIELDPDFAGLDDFLVLYFASVPEILIDEATPGRNLERARFHFGRAMERSNWTATSALLAYAGSISAPAHDIETFRAHVQRVLDINPDDDPANRLLVVLDQRRARWMLDNVYSLFPSWLFD